ncbi:hypothetical protein GJ25_gp040 [Mycobacterium phage Hawkeye]|uniref:Uncharacterized protein n=1 Tax=Mycobacterium phage Hawkeye TaxID=1458711 RepID=X2KSM4_9CAUD|nr:hypothetical protein GJ25_gp040 [Mycobacterium phage Hawkeye]AHN84051.1 hypothetical protein PBI_HAWKEYE_40 [Mycobacterium phage Hawkeye]
MVSVMVVVTTVSCPVSRADDHNQQHSQLCRDEEYVEKHPVECGRVESGPIGINPPTGHGGGGDRRGLLGRILGGLGLGGLL